VGQDPYGEAGSLRPNIRVFAGQWLENSRGQRFGSTGRPKPGSRGGTGRPVVGGSGLASLEETFARALEYEERRDAPRRAGLSDSDELDLRGLLD